MKLYPIVIFDCFIRITNRLFEESDNGTNFRGALRKIRDEMKNLDMNSLLTEFLNIK